MTDPPLTGPPNTPTCSGITQASASRIIGANVGDLALDSRDHVLTIQRKSVGNPTEFGMAQYPRNFVLVRVTPSPFSFNRPAMLTLSYEGCTLQNGKPLKIFRFEPAENRWKPLDSFHNPTDKTVTAAIGTLSDYAMGTD